MLELLKDKLTNLVKSNNLRREEIIINARPLSTEEAIGKTTRDNFPLQTGKEVLVQADFKGSLGQAFTDSPKSFNGSIDDILSLDLDDNFNLALLIATLNAVTRHLGMVNSTIHCQNEEPENCGKEIATQLLAEYGKDTRIGIIGFQPAIIENISQKFAKDKVKISDLNPKNIGTEIAGVKVWDGKKRTGELIKESELILATGSTIANNSLKEIISLCEEYNKELILFGTTIAGAAELLELRRICPYSC
ncbi:Rossmann-like domain-containing protein [Fuchsiella alkaliacetigena]|uniref:Rossmann-like domain-containing protein n=1 Tax=Fuchsiella alkaliacetigena TaxID=957042 RepID=UPI00200B3530|nr:DUF364 domain-containing protein [Fuchsiella alkaliacetigena]MCK8825917.1 DUF364 domain-containing protein [Fuchsiella alkaliacetigena]